MGYFFVKQLIYQTLQPLLQLVIFSDKITDIDNLNKKNKNFFFYFLQITLICL
jgi:hypothetical protein